MACEVPVRARELAARLAALFVADSQLAVALKDAQHRLLGASDRLWSALHPDVFGLACGDPRRLSVGKGAIGERIDARGGGDATGVETAMLGVLEQVHWTIGRAFVDYQRAYEERRRLAVDVGELAQQLIEVLCAAGWSEDRARSADVHELAIARDDRALLCAVLGRFYDPGSLHDDDRTGARSRRARARDRRRGWR
ncbi:MAG TPA: hypothetical protein VFT22_09590 [Kofleriaceae bacterium]|nr:hypothetical protein [Kofleriaceae bacterium]